MPYLTPQALPESDKCRSLSIPEDSEWLALFGGALTELTKAYNWEYSGGLTVDETVSQMMSILNNWYLDSCAACTTPGGYRVIRIGTGGHLEQLDEDGNWVPATDDYEIPPPAAREGGTADDQICLAAKNAVNVLEQLYENIAESFDSHLSEVEAITAFILALIALVGFEFAPITWGIVAFFAVVFHLIYEAVAYLTADLWDENFSKQMTCFLVDCASNDAGVVTFDYDCFTGKLNSLATDFGLSEVQLRLYAQVSFMLNFIGGVDGLNLAGATTEITNDDCEFCEDTWCRTWLFGEGNSPAWTFDFGSYNSGTDQFDGANTSPSGNTVLLQAKLHFDAATVTWFSVMFDFKSGGTFGGNSFQIGNGTTYAANVFDSAAAPTDTEQMDAFLGGDSDPNELTDLWIQIGVPSRDTLDTYLHVTQVTVRGTGDNPVGDDSCE